MSASRDSPSSSSSITLCHVCLLGESYSTYFGVPACRSCNEFYRRCLRTGRAKSDEFVCGRGGNCTIGLVRSEVRYNPCRKCRYERCLALGMARPGGEAFMVPLVSTMLQGPPPPQDTPMPVEINKHPHLVHYYNHLSMVKLNYEKLKALRTASEYELYPLNTDQGQAGLRRISYTMISKMNESAMPKIFEFCNESFDGFRCLQDPEKLTMVRDFFFHMMMFESAYLSVERFGDDTTKRQIVMTGFFDEACFSEENHRDDGVVQKVIYEMLKAGLSDAALLSLRASCSRAQLDAREVAALAGILLWSPEPDSVSDALADECARNRFALYSGLHYYYTTVLQRSEYASRIGSLNDVLLHAKEVAKRKWVENRLFLMFNIWGEESFMHKLYR